MTLYVNDKYYFNTFKGRILSKDVERYLELAQRKIDRITLNRIVAIGFENLTNFQKEKISNAICYQAEYIYQNGYNDEDTNDIESYSVIDISVNIKAKDEKSKTRAEKECMSGAAFDLINQTGLNSSNWRFNG